MANAIRSGKRQQVSGTADVIAAEPKPVVLLVEDHEDTRELYNFVLASHGYDVIEALNGEEAVNVAERFHPSLILMDATLPKLDGVGATKCIREIAPLRGVPIIFLSGRAEPAAMAEARAAGCDDYLVKPIDLDLLDQILAEYLVKENSTFSDGPRAQRPAALEH